MGKGGLAQGEIREQFGAEGPLELLGRDLLEALQGMLLGRVVHKDL
jgi:hypothetical protein